VPQTGPAGMASAEIFRTMLTTAAKSDLNATMDPAVSMEAVLTPALPLRCSQIRACMSVRRHEGKSDDI
jgi:hypothetical protein